MPFDGTQYDSVRRTLIAAKRLLVERGICRGQLEDRAGRLCSLGAIYAASDSGGSLSKIAFLRFCAANGINICDLSGEVMPNALSAWHDRQAAWWRRRGIRRILAGFDQAIVYVPTGSDLCREGQVNHPIAEAGEWDGESWEIPDA
jgi:hypothetical protein